jgi:uncharacterized cupredoxin-like copper-binding protein
VKRRLGLAITLVVALGLSGCATRAQAGGRAEPRTVVLEVRHSRFSPEQVRVEPGELVRFVVVNHDPIDHELIVGPPAVHDAHERGTHTRHGDVPGEVSVPAGERAETTYRLGQPGPVVFACHLPGHLDYGMRGLVLVG